MKSLQYLGKGVGSDPGDVVVNRDRLNYGKTGWPPLIPRRRRELPPHASCYSPAGRLPAMPALPHPPQAHLGPVKVCSVSIPQNNSGGNLD